MHTVIPIVSAERNCDGCTVCCDGWLPGKANEHYFYPGKKCHYVNDMGCSIYDTRPEVPCKSFKCAWLVNTEIPEWMKPSIINAIIILTDDGLLKQRNIISLKIVSWFINLYKQGKMKSNLNQNDEEFLLEMHEMIAKYGKYLILLDETSIPKIKNIEDYFKGIIEEERRKASVV